MFIKNFKLLKKKLSAESEQSAESKKEFSLEVGDQILFRITQIITDLGNLELLHNARYVKNLRNSKKFKKILEQKKITIENANDFIKTEFVRIKQEFENLKIEFGSIELDNNQHPQKKFIADFETQRKLAFTKIVELSPDIDPQPPSGRSIRSMIRSD
jgi:hypothetical protein